MGSYVTSCGSSFEYAYGGSVTIGVVSADMRSVHAKTCIEKIKQHTSNFDLVVLDNNFGPGFNHSHGSKARHCKRFHPKAP